MAAPKQNDKSAAGLILAPASVLILGLALGYAFVELVELPAMQSYYATGALGFVCAYILYRAVKLVRLFLALLGDLIPVELNLADREAVKEMLHTLPRHHPLTSRVTLLLSAWSSGWNPLQVVAMSAAQGTRQRFELLASGALLVALLGACAWQSAPVMAVWGSLAALVLVWLLHAQLLLQADRYIEAQVLVRLPANVQHTAITAAEMAELFGGAVKQAFKEYLPQPEQTAKAIREAVEQAVKQTAVDVEKIQKALADQHKALAEQWNKNSTSITTEFAKVEKIVKDLTSGFTSSLQATADKIGATLGGHSKELENVVAGLAAQLNDRFSSGTGLMKTALVEHVNGLKGACETLAGQLNIISGLEKEIQQVLSLQGVLDGTLKTMAASEAIKNTLATLNSTLESTNKAMELLSRPRTIQLVELDEGTNQ